MSVVIRTRVHNVLKYVRLQKGEMDKIDVFLSKGNIGSALPLFFHSTFEHNLTLSIV